MFRISTITPRAVRDTIYEVNLLSDRLGDRLNADGIACRTTYENIEMLLKDLEERLEDDEEAEWEAILADSDLEDGSVDDLAEADRRVVSVAA